MVYSQFIQSLKQIVSSNKIQAKHVINLGITNRRLHDIERVTITGQAGVSLIASQSQKVNIPESCLKKIGEFLIYVNDYMLPKTPFADVYKTQNEDELKYLEMFAEQLKLDKNSGRDRFRFAALTILINDHLSPHVDAMNLPEENDYTMAFSMFIPLEEIPSDIHDVLEMRYPNGVPLCIVVYRQRCLEILSKRRIRWNNFVANEENEMRGRQSLLNIIKQANTYDDYIGTFWSPAIVL